jgi:dCMP deaminase
MRPSFDSLFMMNAENMSLRSTCKRLKVGAVLVRDNVPLMSGYNGSISGHDHCTDVGDLMYENGCKRTIHAEMNVISQCAKFGIPTNNATMYVTHYPCPECMKHLAQAGIKRVVYQHFYEHRYENDFDRDIELVRFEEGM